MLISQVESPIPALQRYNFQIDPRTQGLISSYLSDKSIKEIQKHYSNGLSHLIQNIEIEIVSDIKKCKILWKHFSPDMSLFDSWDFRKAFYNSYKYEPHFLLVKSNGELKALLPLWYDNQNWWGEENHYCWFGSNWCENNTFFAKDENFIPFLLYLAPKPLHLSAITINEIEKTNKMFQLEQDESKYVLDIENKQTLEDYLSTLKKKLRYNLKRDMRKIELLNPTLVFDKFDDLETMFNLNVKRFSATEYGSDVSDKRRRNVFYEIINNSGRSYTSKIISVYIKQQLVAVDLICIKGDTYYALKGASSCRKYSGLGNFMNLFEIEDAIKMKLKAIDFLQEDCGWKHKWFEEVKLYKYSVE